MSQKIDKIDALIFIDTNIFLDFYRIRTSDVSMSYLEKIASNLDRIITGSQIAMEYKKNRQKVILESLEKIKKPDWNSLTPPAFLSQAQPVKIINAKKKDIEKQQTKIKERIEKIISNPMYNDEVYKTLQRLFKNNSPYNFGRDKKERHQIRILAKKRFILGYPPRKKEDNSIGDAINWEWIINCAISSGKDIILVSRDTDFGIAYNGKNYLNDWLNQEFKERVSSRRKIILTDKLTQAFKMVDIQVTKEMEREELTIIHGDQVENAKEIKMDEKIIFDLFKIYFEKKNNNRQ